MSTINAQASDTAAAERQPLIEECRFIRLSERDQYERDGWEVTPMQSFHCQWSHIATRMVPHG